MNMTKKLKWFWKWFILTLDMTAVCTCLLIIFKEDVLSWKYWLTVGIFSVCSFISNSAFQKKLLTYNKAIPALEPNSKNVFSCEIETPQFQGSDHKFIMFRQTGTFYLMDMMFLPDDVIHGHGVAFPDIESFRESLVRVL